MNICQICGKDILPTQSIFWEGLDEMGNSTEGTKTYHATCYAIAHKRNYREVSPQGEIVVLEGELVDA